MAARAPATPKDQQKRRAQQCPVSCVLFPMELHKLFAGPSHDGHSVHSVHLLAAESCQKKKKPEKPEKIGASMLATTNYATN